jgi:hypothetical protein
MVLKSAIFIPNKFKKFKKGVHITKHKLLKLAVINTLFGDRRITYAVEYD